MSKAGNCVECGNPVLDVKRHGGYCSECAYKIYNKEMATLAIRRERGELTRDEYKDEIYRLRRELGIE